MARLFIDSGVLIAAARGEAPLREAAVRLLTNPRHVFLTSPFVYLETVPKAQFGRRELELALYQLYFEHAQSLDDLPRLLPLALHISAQEGVGPMDSLHVAAAILLEADVLVTIENKGKSIYRAKAMAVQHLLG